MEIMDLEDGELEIIGNEPKIRIEESKLIKLEKLPQWMTDRLNFQNTIKKWKEFFSIILQALDQARKENREIKNWWERWGRVVFDLIRNVIKIIAKI